MRRKVDDIRELIKNLEKRAHKRIDYTNILIISLLIITVFLLLQSPLYA